MKKYVTNILENKFLEKYDIKENKATYSEMKTININYNLQKQNWLGIGGALTQSTTYNYLKLNKEKQENFIKDYFSKDGLNYKFVRLPIASCDFSPYSYEYIKNIDGNDFDIEKDEKLIFPLLNEIKEKYKLEYIASPWSPPKVWKENKSLFRGGKLKKEYYKSYAEYLVKYIKIYNKKGVKINFLSMQNEPFAKQLWESCEFDLIEQKNFLYKYLIPKFKEEKIDTKILLWDHNKEDLYNVTKKLYRKDMSIAGTCFHWYSGNHFEQIRLVKENFPNILLINSESCTRYSLRKKNILNGAELLLEDILGDINAGMNAYVDWNMLLDFKGGPNHKLNFCNAPIMLNFFGKSYKKNAIYYYLKHLSLIPEGTKVLDSSTYDKNLQTVCFRKANMIYCIVMNTSNFDKKVNVFCKNKVMHDKISKHSIVTYELDIVENKN